MTDLKTMIERASATVEKLFVTPGLYEGRIESFDASGLIGNGSARAFSFLVKAPPVASFVAPALVAEGAALVLDGTASTFPALPEGNHIASYRWSMGDGKEIVQKPGDADFDKLKFGKLDYRYASHGVWEASRDPTTDAMKSFQRRAQLTLSSRGCSTLLAP